MATHTPAERALFADLTRLLLAMRDASHSDVEACIEERFRDFLRAEASQGASGEVGGLQITFTWTLPEGADDWAVYSTEYRTVPAEPRALAQQAAVAGGAGGAASVIAFPPPHAGRPASPKDASAVVIAFPDR